MSLKEIRERMQAQEQRLGPDPRVVLTIEQLRAHARRALHDIYIDEITSLDNAIIDRNPEKASLALGVLLGAALATLRNSGIFDREFDMMQRAINKVLADLNARPRDYGRIASDRREITLAFAVL